MGKARRKNENGFLFEQVYDFILHRIERGEWQGNEKLPSIRQLSLEMKVHRLTVFKAFQLLKEQNKVYVVDKKGYYVQIGNASKEAESPPIVTAYPKENQLAAVHAAPVMYQFSQALIDPNLLPNHYLSDYVKKVFDLYPKVLATYATVEGDPELRESLAHYFMNIHKTYVTPENILITTGSQQAIHLIAQAFVKPRDTVLIERPAYSAAIDTFKNQGANIVAIDITEKGYDLDRIEDYMKTYKPRLFYLNPTFHNPTGYVVPVFQRKRLVELAEQHNCLLVEDDAYPDIYFEKQAVQPVYTFDTTGSVIYVRSFCKYVSPGLRVAAVLCPPALRPALITVKSLADNGSPLLNQKIFLHFFHSERMQQHFSKLRIALQIRKEIMEEELSETGWQWESPKGGLNLWVKLNDDVSGSDLLKKAIEQSVSFVPGVYFDPYGQDHSRVRLTYSYMNEVKIKEGIRKLVHISQSLNGKY
ncbi:PLP-dependent aminotransferase family protein [Domibacillus robiginosus]|uniref:aminotransferase-like domain-containing protein n=1 Tax=Domibacillus robiginosus TaxID=1071054 RepID=UPI00067BE494|nr:PLP-dependent aminotransferase family protein [Domibacillus robiginosus]